MDRRINSPRNFLALVGVLGFLISHCPLNAYAKNQKSIDQARGFVLLEQRGGSSPVRQFTIELEGGVRVSAPEVLVSAHKTFRHNKSYTWFQWNDARKSAISNLIARDEFSDFRLVMLDQDESVAAVTVRSKKNGLDHLYLIDLTSMTLEKQKPFDAPVENGCWIGRGAIFLIFSRTKTDFSGMGLFKAIAGHPVPASSFSFGIFYAKEDQSMQSHSLTQDVELYTTAYADCSKASVNG